MTASALSAHAAFDPELHYGAYEHVWRASSPLATFEELYTQYFREGAVDESNLDRVDGLSGDQIMVWSMLSALYTIDLMGEALESDVVVERVELVLRSFWPCVRHVAMVQLHFPRHVISRQPRRAAEVQAMVDSSLPKEPKPSSRSQSMTVRY
ncbi:hypothetical protein Purlil1_13343 [Purpureocillium lilacinum]|uniref:Uncharacterized protein n=1 Tax=Purpureocillium lilacinum TaxID=33203 RepID=A0ABR0BEB0_PURLI|nr:hypothetical protein Purlil1_13343 [Purpureocillium lilacinum]